MCKRHSFGNSLKIFSCSFCKKLFGKFLKIFLSNCVDNLYENSFDDSFRNFFDSFNDNFLGHFFSYFSENSFCYSFRNFLRKLWNTSPINRNCPTSERSLCRDTCGMPPRRTLLKDLPEPIIFERATERTSSGNLAKTYSELHQGELLEKL